MPAATGIEGATQIRVARVNDRDAAEALLEHRSTKGGYMHGVFYSQEHVNRRATDMLASAQDLLVS